MRFNQTIIAFLLVIQIFCRIMPAGIAQKPLAAGEIIEKIQCLNDQSESYSLFLPQGYHRLMEKKWPVLFIFDPGGRGKISLTQFHAAALTYGLILVCPLNSKNGPFPPVVKAMQSVWREVDSRFRINRERIYASGFSGGARVATFFSRVIQQPVQGVIACGAGLSSAIKPNQLTCPLYFGLVGISDFNYQEMRKLDITLDNILTIHHFHFFQGGHQWPGQDLCNQAWEWMELQSRRKGISSLPVSKIQAIYAHHLSRIKRRETAGDIYFTVHEYRSLVATFGLWIDMTRIVEKIKILESSSPFKEFKAQEAERMKQENQYLRKAIGAFSHINKNSPNEIKINKLSHWIGLAKLKSLAKKKDSFISAVGRRILYNVASHAESEAKNKMEKGEYQRALLFIKLAITAGKEHYFYPSLLYNMARIYAAQKKIKKTIKILDQVKARTTLDANFVRNDPYMKNLLQKSAFQKYLNSLNIKKSDKK